MRSLLVYLLLLQTIDNTVIYMSITKIAKDHLVRLLLGKDAVPEGLVELNRYFRINDPIHFEYHKEDGVIVAVSSNFLYGSIVTHGRDMEELDRNIKDAILTSFEVPSSYTKEAGIRSEGEASQCAYALA